MAEMKNIYESPFFRKITRVADFFLVTLCFLVTSIPLVTFFTALTAMYYTMAKALRYDAAPSTVRCYFHSFKENLKQGLLIGVLTLLAAAILYTFVDVANAVGWHTLYSKIYLVLTVVYGTVVIAVVLNLAAVISRFQVKTLSGIKLAGRFALARPAKMLTYVITLVGIIFLSYILPPLTLVLPGGFAFSFTYYAEPLLMSYMEEHLAEEQIPGWMKEDEEEEGNESS